MWNIWQTCNLCGKELYKKFPIFTSNLIRLNNQDFRNCVSGLAEFCMKKHFKFDCTKEIEKEMVCTGLYERMMVNLLDPQDWELQHIAYEEQFNNLRNQMFQNLKNLVLLMHLETKNIWNFFSWQNLSKVNKRSEFDAPARSQ